MDLRRSEQARGLGKDVQPLVQSDTPAKLRRKFPQIPRHEPDDRTSTAPEKRRGAYRGHGQQHASASRRGQRQELYDGGIRNETQTVRSGKEAYDRRAESSRAADGERIPHIVSHGEDTHCGQGGFGEKQAAAVCVKSGDGRLGFCHHRAVELCKDSRIAGASGTENARRDRQNRGGDIGNARRRRFTHGGEEFGAHQKRARSHAQKTHRFEQERRRFHL